MPNLADEFRKQGFDEEYIRGTLLPNTGLLDYPGDIDFTVHPLRKNLGIETELFKVTTYGTNGQGKKIKSFVIKDHLPIDQSKELYGEKPRPSSLRYKTEKSILNIVGRPRLIASNGNRRRLIMEEWDGSLDELLMETFSAYEHAKDNPDQQHRFKSFARGYVGNAIRQIVRVSDQITKNLPELMETELELKKTAAGRKYKLRRQLKAIVGLGLEGKSESERNQRLRDLSRQLEKREPLNDELLALAGFLTRGNRLIHYDSRSSNFLVRREPGASTKLPHPDYVTITPCDYVDVRQGPLSFDIASLANDQYWLLFNPRLDDRLQLFNTGFIDALEAAKKPSRDSLDDLCREEFMMASVVALIKNAGNAIAFEKDNKERFDEYLQIRPVEINRDNAWRNTLAILETLEGLGRFPRLRHILGETLDDLQAQRTRNRSQQKRKNKEHGKEMNASGGG